MNGQVLKHLMALAAKGPSHVIYFFKNVHPVRDNFPALYEKLTPDRRLDLGEPFALRKLHVVLRTTDFVMNVNKSRNLEEAGIVSKSDVIRMGGCSLFPAAKRFAERHGRESIKITLVEDRLSEQGLAQYRSAALAVGLDFDVVSSSGHGNGPSFQTQIDVALEDDDETLELILEDDYLLDEQALCLPFDLMRAHSNIAGFTPHFHPDRVRFQDVGRLAVHDGRLFCRVPSTCCTFFMAHATLRKNEKHLRLYDGWEKGSIGNVWERSICLSPLGWTLAEHLHRSDLSPVQKLVRPAGTAASV